MSRTDKDIPYRIRVERDGVIDHDHTNGACVVGTYYERRMNNRARNAHRRGDNCSRKVYVTNCVHDAARETYQNQIHTIRHKHTVNYVRPDYMIQFLPDRVESADAMMTMLRAGYFPNCMEAETHAVDIREVDLRLRPGEDIGGYNVPMRPVYLTTPAILLPTYDEEVPCEACEEYAPINCYRRDAEHYKHQCTRSCDYCYPSGNEPRVRRARARNELNRVRALYNTFGESE